MKSMAQGGTGKPLFSEVFTKVNNAKVKAKKVEILKENDTPGLRRILKGAFDPKLQWDLQKANHITWRMTPSRYRTYSIRK